MPWVFDSRRTFAGVVLAGMGLIAHASAGNAPILIAIESANSALAVAQYRLTSYLQAQGCRANIHFDAEVPGLALAFLPGAAVGDSDPILEAVNRDGQRPVPVWVTRSTAGVRDIRELQGRDLATVAGTDPLGGNLALAALRERGITPRPEQLYEAGDYSSALGLLLHNNTHAAVSELGFVQPLLTGNSLVVSWQGSPVQAGGWYRQNGWSEHAGVCEQALARSQRAADPQMFAAFPEWVSGFALPGSQDTGQ
ncbi:type 2 periplasmic-binding domain-containing protein [Pseudomonas saliphila]|uniref:hypothetical protein n=1 Tax=Pseudomonas saliphila TaxID=2586906 RepID=UPI0019D56AC3|nr:hypothetical protein [Pseudomonas saliphila]